MTGKDRTIAKRTIAVILALAMGLEPAAGYLPTNILAYAQEGEGTGEENTNAAADAASSAPAESAHGQAEPDAFRFRAGAGSDSGVQFRRQNL